ncbi:MAG: alpha-galactosidase [Clostridia bacterium]|nr:alpha-galactosidase [Clostridia bacterium]
MSVLIKENIITLNTKNTTYQMAVNPNNYLAHLYYGALLDDSLAIERGNVGYHTLLPLPYDCRNREFSSAVCPLEYSAYGCGDFRTTPLKVRFSDGSSVCDLIFESANYVDSKPKLEGLPALHDNEGKSQSVEICLKDKVHDLRVYLLYTAFEEYDIIARSVRIENHTGGDLILESVLSTCLDNYEDEYDLITFDGKPYAERTFHRTPLGDVKLTCESKRGSSSHQCNPFFIFATKNCDEKVGECYGSAFVYSGNYTASMEKTPIGTTRFVMGINPENFNFLLKDGESFQAPEVIHSYSNNGFSKLTHNYHDVIRKHLFRGKYADAERPILINNWEATYFKFTAEKLLDIAKKAKAIGVDTFVLDDGWFLGRNSDNSSLGDWFVDEEKLGCPLNQLIKEINALGMKFGLWFEPECISENSNLYRAHPNWVLQAPDRKGALGRKQWVIDMSNPDAVDGIFGMMSDILDNNNIEYIKWDFNRYLTDVYSHALPADSQGEVHHRYVLGVYDLLERILKKYPNVLIEGCASGGGRFDCGMLYYSPQYWTSDNTDPMERLSIQYGTSFCYPIIAMGSHVTESPNHVTKRDTPFKTRSNVAMAGTYGFELDLTKLSSEEIEFLANETNVYKKYSQLIRTGDYYRLTSNSARYMGWQFVSNDKLNSLAVIVQRTSNIDFKPIIQKFEGLNPSVMYRVVIDGKERENLYSGNALMNIGLNIRSLKYENESTRIEILSAKAQ